jgi:hypothetical protein
MEEDCGGGQGLTKGCGAKGRRSNKKVQIGLDLEPASSPLLTISMF